jgi:hypothetical protein
MVKLARELNGTWRDYTVWVLGWCSFMFFFCSHFPNSFLFRLGTPCALLGPLIHLTFKRWDVPSPVIGVKWNSCPLYLQYMALYTARLFVQGLASCAVQVWQSHLYKEGGICGTHLQVDHSCWHIGICCVGNWHLFVQTLEYPLTLIYIIMECMLLNFLGDDRCGITIIEAFFGGTGLTKSLWQMVFYTIFQVLIILQYYCFF